MARKDLLESLTIPPGITVTKEGAYLVVKGAKGAIKRRFDNPSVQVELQNNEIKLSVGKASKRDKAVIQSYKIHLKNAFNGAKEHYVYKLKVCSGHFPMSVSVTNNIMYIKNFLGEKVPRTVKLKEGASVKVDGIFVTVESADKELAGQVAADIEQATRRPGFDKRIFQDGIYIVEKAGKPI